MPAKKDEDLPSTIARSDEHAKAIYSDTLDSAEQEYGERRAVGALALAVGLDRRVVGLHPGVLGLLRRAGERRGQLLATGHRAPPGSSGDRSGTVHRLVPRPGGSRTCARA